VIRKLIKTLLWAFGLVVGLIAALGAYYFWPVARLPNDAPPTKIVVEKADRRLRVMSGEKTIAAYGVSLGGNPLGDKQCEGDNRTPEGVYVLDGKNAGSGYYRAFHVSYPNDDDRRQAAARGCSPGGDIMVHALPNGLGWIGRFHRFRDWTRGCIAITNEEMDQLWRAVPVGTPIEIRP
jgi:murein L,D-transpeptidase YafK